MTFQQKGSDKDASLVLVGSTDQEETSVVVTVLNRQLRRWQNAVENIENINQNRDIKRRMLERLGLRAKR
jgi:hypothetical protein